MTFCTLLRYYAKHIFFAKCHSFNKIKWRNAIFHTSLFNVTSRSSLLVFNISKISWRANCFLNRITRNKIWPKSRFLLACSYKLKWTVKSCTVFLVDNITQQIFGKFYHDQVSLGCLVIFHIIRPSCTSNQGSWCIFHASYSCYVTISQNLLLDILKEYIKKSLYSDCKNSVCRILINK